MNSTVERTAPNNHMLRAFFAYIDVVMSLHCRLLTLLTRAQDEAGQPTDEETFHIEVCPTIAVEHVNNILIALNPS
jgi:hypothetical protein